MVARLRSRWQKISKPLDAVINILLVVVLGYNHAKILLANARKSAIECGIQPGDTFPMDGLGKPLQLDGLFVGSSHIPLLSFIRQQYLNAVVPNLLVLWKRKLTPVI